MGGTYSDTARTGGSVHLLAIFFLANDFGVVIAPALIAVRIDLEFGCRVGFVPTIHNISERIEEGRDETHLGVKSFLR